MAAGNAQPMQIAGKPADVCPYCGCAMFAYKTLSEFVTTERRLIECRNSKCGRAFESQQPLATIVREVERRKDSSSGKPHLTLVNEAG
jgi:hypothetical protein